MLYLDALKRVVIFRIINKIRAIAHAMVAAMGVEMNRGACVGYDVLLYGPTLEQNFSTQS